MSPRLSRAASHAGRLAVLTLALATPAHGQTCGDPDGDGRMTLIDGIVILRAAAGLATSCTAEACDMDGNGTISLVDGVTALRGAADLAVSLDCPRPAEPSCLDLAGHWEKSERIDITCRIRGEDESAVIHGVGPVTIEQDGCELVWHGVDLTRSGVIDGNTVTFRGPFDVDEDGISYSTNEVTLTGEVDAHHIVLEGSAVTEGTARGVPFSCTAAVATALDR